jgi:precorrin-2 dehydrogenase/sirohydrochlorin ferrochelatase
MTDYYPIYLQLQGQPCSVIGGGRIAEDKVNGLLAAGGRVTIVSPDLTPHLQELVERDEIIHIARHYQPGDLAGAFIVISATNQTEINHQVWQEASAHGQLVNVVDDTPRCNFIVRHPAQRRFNHRDFNGWWCRLAVRLKEHSTGIGPKLHVS